MENYLVSARKYRPSTFKSVVGQDAITETLRNAIKNNQLAQAFLFCGPRGVGKTSCARILAKTINCQNLQNDIEACNECESCKSFNASASFNIHELDAASNSGVEDIRNLVDQVRIPPQAGKYKVYIIDEVHMLSASAFNAFLKTLEEPPPYAKFILATTEKHKIIPTILSRCQIFDFQRITVQDIAKHLLYVAKQEKVKTEEQALLLIAQKSDGALRDALSMFDQIVSYSSGNVSYEQVCENLNILDYDYYFRFVDLALESNIPAALELFNQVLKKGFDSYYFLTGFAEHFRNLLVGKDNITVDLMDVGQKVKEKYIEQANKTSLNFLIQSISILTKADINYKESYNKRLLVELCLMQICSFYQNKAAEETQKKNTKQSVKEKTPKQETTAAPIKTSPENNNKKKQEVPKQEKKSAEFTHKKTIAAGGISIKELEKSLESQNQVAEENLQKGPLNDFSADQMIVVWDEYLASIKDSKKNIFSILNRCKPRLTSENKIEIFVENKVAEYEIISHREMLVPYLRKKLENAEIDLIVTLNQEKLEKKAYTNEEKFKTMADKNPHLHTLKQELHLDYY
ncbi:MAG TPA: DNA polymerase III subunit gamma/tau [Bacteroidetes bacterium]|nr:DNA polymerase III subunit gamma/tau [Bacteroidota bacterium]